jgi:hypothetical protein
MRLIFIEECGLNENKFIVRLLINTFTATAINTNNNNSNNNITNLYFCILGVED